MILDGYHFALKGASYTLRTFPGPEETSPEDIWWRAIDKRYATWDPYDDDGYCSGSNLHIELHPYLVVKTTPKGVWLRERFSTQFFVLGTAIRQIAVPTKELAIHDLVARKRVHVQGAESRFKRAVEHLTAAETLLGEFRQVEEVTG